MKLIKNFGLLLLAAWLILTGLIPLFNLSFSGLGTVMSILAVVAGILIVVGRKDVSAVKLPFGNGEFGAVVGAIGVLFLAGNVVA